VSSAGERAVAGVDEAGRGPLAGPVVAAAVVLGGAAIEGLADSKRLSERARERLAPLIRERAAAWAVGVSWEAEIDAVNILQATYLAMGRALRGLGVTPELVLVDGNRTIPSVTLPQKAIVHGDATEPAISAASILAKTARDALLRELDARYPEYGFAQHKGYGCASHLRALACYGPCPVHRRSFAPVRELLEADESLDEFLARHLRGDRGGGAEGRAEPG
jgi:ribonuclease HII